MNQPQIPTNQSSAPSQLSRRKFQLLAASLVASGSLPLLGNNSLAGEIGVASNRASLLNPLCQASDASLKGRIWKTLKIGMTGGVPGTLTDKFKAAKAAGFDGIEMDIPGMNVQETKEAIRESGLIVDGSVCSTHWQIRHTDPDPQVRQKALQDLQQAIRDTDAVGGKSVLLVVGHGRDGELEDIWQRALDNVKMAIPLAAQMGISILVENVWNHFMYDHDGGSDQTAEHFVRFIDELNSPWVGMQFDIGNHWKYGSMGDWIRQLGKRIYKLDVKGFSRQESKFTDIGQGDIDWADVRAALLEIDYHGWAAAEVGGGDLPRLKTISQQMDEVFKLV